MSMTNGSYVGVETRLERQNTAMLIALYGLPITLTRPAPYVLNNAGGTVRTGSPTTFPAKKRWYGTQGKESYEQQADVGAGAMLRHFLIGPWDDDIQTGDHFVSPVDSRKFVVQFVHQDRRYETRAVIEPLT